MPLLPPSYAYSPPFSPSSHVRGTRMLCPKIASGQAGGVGVIARFLDGDTGESSPEESVVLAALSALSDVCQNTELNRDAFIYTNMNQVCRVICCPECCWQYSTEA